jgi:hypothetical protein
MKNLEKKYQIACKQHAHTKSDLEVAMTEIRRLQDENLRLKMQLAKVNPEIGHEEEDYIQLKRELKIACKKNEIKLSYTPRNKVLRYCFKVEEKKYRRIDFSLNFSLALVRDKLDDLVKTIKMRVEKFRAEHPDLSIGVTQKIAYIKDEFKFIH